MSLATFAVIVGCWAAAKLNIVEVCINRVEAGYKEPHIKCLKLGYFGIFCLNIFNLVAEQHNNLYMVLSSTQ